MKFYTTTNRTEIAFKPESHEANLLAANALAANKFVNSLSETGYSLLAGSTRYLI